MWAIIGAVAGAALALGSAKHEASKIDITNERLEKIEAAIKLHTFSAGYLPCPADPTELPGTPGYGISADCNTAAPTGIATTNDGTPREIWIGGVPTRSLNLPDNYMYDGWLNRFSYAVVADLAISANMFSEYATSDTTGVIQILDAYGNQVPDAGDRYRGGLRRFKPRQGY